MRLPSRIVVTPPKLASIVNRVVLDKVCGHSSRVGT